MDISDFWSKIEKTDEDGCWTWTGYIENGRGRFYFLGKEHYAPRMAFSLTYGELDEARRVYHSCGNRLCCNPTHLTLSRPKSQIGFDERFWSKINKSDPDSCWEWTSAKTPQGYGLFTLQGKRQVYAHRLSYELNNGKIPDGLLVRHKCDNPPCCNPRHLIVGTELDNAMDAKERGRFQYLRVIPVPVKRYVGRKPRKLTDGDIREIRSQRKQGKFLKELSDFWCVSESMISRIVNMQRRASI